MDFFEKISDNPIIAAVNNLEKVDDAIDSPAEIIFMLTGDIFTIGDIVKKIQAKGKSVFLHIDLLDGFSRDAIALEYISKTIKPDGIITTKNNLVKIAMDLGLFTIQRFFILDSLSLAKGIQAMKHNRPNAIEILPGVNSKITKIVIRETKIPVITGGLIMDKEDVINSIKAGAIGISTTKKELWYE